MAIQFWLPGSNESVNELIVETTKVIDLKGKIVVPGFNDAHEHLAWKEVQELGLVVVYTPQFGMGESIPEQDSTITKAPLKSLIEAGIPPGYWHRCSS